MSVHYSWKIIAGSVAAIAALGAAAEATLAEGSGSGDTLDDTVDIKSLTVRQTSETTIPNISDAATKTTIANVTDAATTTTLLVPDGLTPFDTVVSAPSHLTPATGPSASSTTSSENPEPTATVVSVPPVPSQPAVESQPSIDLPTPESAAQIDSIPSPASHS